jgi:hypothetical protein
MRPKRITFRFRQHPHLESGRAGGLEEWMRPRATAQLPVEEQPRHVEARPHADVGCPRRRTTDGEVDLKHTTRGAEDAIARLRVARHLMSETDKRQRGRPSIPERCLATGRVPTMHPRRREPNARDAIGALVEADRVRCNLHDVAATVRVEQVRPPELMRVRLAIFAITHHAIDSLRRDVAEDSPHFTAPTRELDVARHQRSRITKPQVWCA